jgi:hypothetical protein
VRFIDGEPHDVPAFELGDEALEHQPLGGDVEQLEFASAQAFEAPRAFGRGKRRVEIGRGDPRGLQRVDLIFHQRDQRRDDDGQALRQERR